jgi:uncharacterized protein YkwD
MRLRLPVALVLLATGGGCLHRDSTGSGPVEPSRSAAESEPASTAPVPEPAPAGKRALSRAGPRTPMTVPEARRYMVTLINLDRAAYGLPAVEFDEGAASRAGQTHAEDMARHGYLGHWGTDGSVPEQRMTDAGGADMVLENASCFVDEKERTLDRSPLIDPKNVEKAEEMFFQEQPPHDGHRKNILKGYHKRVGIGIAQPVASATEIPVPCFSQEFVDPYGSYAPVPRRVHLGDTLHVEGTIFPPATVGGIGLARMDAPEKIPVSEANKRRSYPVPQPYQMYWPAGFKTPIPLKVGTSGKFSIEVPVDDGSTRSGLYELSVWAKLPGSTEFVMVGLRTIDVR